MLHGIALRVVLLGVLYALGVGTGVWLHKKVTDSRELARIQSEREAQQAQAKAEAQKAADALNAQATLQQTINRLRAKVPDAQTPSVACLDAGRLLDINEAIRAANTAGGASPTLPADPSTE
ncbi:hypothetical protein IP84_17100 [beta proteobacterium AAP99]|nr:hypothetical protein IP84_17100 [beta proteobacterium AAP99]